MFLSWNKMQKDGGEPPLLTTSGNGNGASLSPEAAQVHIQMPSGEAGGLRTCLRGSSEPLFTP